MKVSPWLNPICYSGGLENITVFSNFRVSPAVGWMLSAGMRFYPVFGAFTPFWLAIEALLKKAMLKTQLALDIQNDSLGVSKSYVENFRKDKILLLCSCLN